MFPIFLAGLCAGVILANVVFLFLKNMPSNAKFKLQEEQLKGAQVDLQMFEKELKAELKKEN